MTSPLLKSRPPLALWERVGAAVRALLPEGRPLPYGVWQARHRGIVVLLWLHVVGLFAYGVSTLEQPLHVLAEVSAIAATALLASWPRLNRELRTLVASAGLVSCSALLVHLSGGFIEMHFHFFVMIAVVTLYQSWRPYLIAIVYVLLHHGIVGVLDPTSVYNHVDAWHHPWKWAGIHASFVLAASIAGLITWRLNEALRARGESILESAGEGICGLDEEGRLTFINSAGAELVGYKAEDMIGQSWHGLVHPSEAELPAEAGASCWMARELVAWPRDGHQSLSSVLHTKSGTGVAVECTSVPVRADSSDGIVLTFRDITDRLKAEEAIRDLNAELERRVQELARSNAELELFAYAASHDLQEPLRMVSSFVQLLGKRYTGRLDAEADEFIGFAVDGVSRMQRLINDLLTYSRVGSQGGELAPADAAAAARQACGQLQAAIEESDAQVTIGELPTVNADATQLVQLFQNLIGNAIKFRGERACVVKVGALRTGDEWRFSITDNGIGLEEEYVDRIFVLFQRLHSVSEYAGTGIGLAICKRIVERHGGRIWVESALGEGSAFHFTLPASTLGGI